MKFYKLAFLYSAFGQGYGITSPIKWAAAVFGVGSAVQGANLMWIIAGTIVYFFFCIGVGILCFKYGWVEALAEVGNKYNPFVKEMRHYTKKKKNI